MKAISRFRSVLIATAALCAPIANADVYCTITNFVVDTYDHGGVYLHGTLTGGIGINFLVLCGTTAGTQDCNSKATDRRLAVALSAQAQGKPLTLYFSQLWSSCSQVTNYSMPTTIQIAP
jgi:hypothetical protein